MNDGWTSVPTRKEKQQERERRKKARQREEYEASLRLANVSATVGLDYETYTLKQGSNDAIDPWDANIEPTTSNKTGNNRNESDDENVEMYKKFREPNKVKNKKKKKRKVSIMNLIMQIN